MPRSYLSTILDASLVDLNELLLSDAGTKVENLYAKCLQSYMLNDLFSLDSFIQKFQGTEDPDSEIYFYIGKKRYFVRKNEKNTLERPEKINNELLFAELLFVEAMEDENFSKNKSAYYKYKEAQKLFYKLGSKKKAVKSLHNSIVAQSRVNPELKLIPYYMEAVRAAKACDEPITCAAALLNISREFHLMKALNAALNYVNKSLDILAEHGYGTYNFYFSLVHRCQLQIELENYREALLDFEEASASSFEELNEPLVMIKEWLVSKNISSDVFLSQNNRSLLIPTWCERRDEKLLSETPLSKKEAELIKLLSIKSRTKNALIEVLWGNSASQQALDNRFKQLVHRIRKKDNELIIYHDGVYSLRNNFVEATG